MSSTPRSRSSTGAGPSGRLPGASRASTGASRVSGGTARAAGGATRATRPPAPRPPAAVRAEAAPLTAPAGAIRRHGPDAVILVAVLALTALGLLVVYSSSAMDGYLGGSTFEDTFETLGPQLQWAAIGLVGMLLAMRLDYRWLRLASVPLLLVAGALLVLIQVPAFQVTVGGSAQWLKLPGLPAVQPSELAKLALVVYLAHWLARRGGAVSGLRSGLVPFVVIVAPFALLIFASPDIGSAAVVGFTAVTLFFLAGANPVYLVGLAAAAAAAAAIFLRDYQLARLQSFTDPFADPLNTGYHAVQGLLALGLGGLVGAGLGERAAAGGIVLPNAHNDYIFAVIGQEFGFLGAVAVIGLFAPPGVSWVPRRARSAGHVRRAARRRDHGLALRPGVRQHRRRRDAPPRHGDHAAIRLGRRVLADRQPRRGGDPPCGLPRDRRPRRVGACRW